MARISAFAPWNWIVGAGSYIDEFEAAEQRVGEIAASSRLLIGAVALFSLLAAIGVWWSVSRRISGRMGDAAARLRDGSAQVHSASREIAKASGQLSSAASQQAAALEETSASLVQIQKVVTDLDRETQGTAAFAEETAASSEELDKQSGLMTEVVEELELIVHGPR